ncbi:DUF6941 family protein [Methyloferula stellata]|uniref:DUF6941 family protein n=1 Tax=Methyloferula stellata TaxID=876270 RepID=UPI00190F573A|nr:hypothetical protein [Methyloferula stellata]
MEPYGITIFCDDIRFEQQNKLMLIGSYGSDLIVNSALPVALPKLCFFVQLRFPPMKISSLKISIYLPESDEAFFTQELPVNAAEIATEVETPSLPPMLGDIQRQMAVNFPITISPVLLTQEGYLKVRAIYDGEILRVGALRISSTSTRGNVFIEARPIGRKEGEPIEDYVVEDHAENALATFKTQAEAIAWAKTLGHSPLVARVRHLNDKAKPDHWRSAD